MRIFIGQPAAQPPEEEETPSWRQDSRRVCLIACLSAVLALALNFFHVRPVPLLASDGPGAWPERGLRITIAEVKKMAAERQPLLMLDVRRMGAYRVRHVAAALSVPAIPTEAFLKYYPTIAPFISAVRTAVLICESDDCATGDRIAQLLKELKHDNVRVLAGGFDACKDSGLEMAGEGP